MSNVYMNNVYYGRAHCGTCQCKPGDVRHQKMVEFRSKFEEMLASMKPLMRTIDDAEELAKWSRLPIELVVELHNRREWS